MTDARVPSTADLIWNRACTDLGDRVGDRHLRALLLVHGMVMNGGPNHAAGSCEPAQLTAAADACRYFGLPQLAALMLQLPAAAFDEDAEDRLSAAYYDLVPDDATIVAAFEARYAEAPADFAAPH